MDDQLMNSLRAEPRREFAEQLRRTLQGQDATQPPTLASARARRYALVAGGLVVVFVLLGLPSMRASAQAFLNLFRVVNVTAVPVNVDRINQLSHNGFDLSALIGEQTKVLTDPGAPQVFSTPLEAANAAGMRRIKLPGVVPPNLVMVKVEVQGERAIRVTADTRKLQSVLDAMAISDVRPPAGLDGQVATVRVPPIVRLLFANGNQEIAFLQARSPEVTMPAGIDLPVLGEIGLRIAGLSQREAHTLAQAIDWQGTLIVPVPAGASSFRQVEVRGVKGLLVESTERRDIKAVIWSDGGIVYGISGPLNNQSMLQMAESVQ